MGAGIVHTKPHPLAGKRAHFRSRTDVADGTLRNGGIVTVRDWYDRHTNARWRDEFGDSRTGPATGYAKRRQRSPHTLPNDDDVVIVITLSGQFRAVHNTELHEVQEHDRPETIFDRT